MRALDVRAVNPRLTLGLHLLYATGLRLSEALAARAGDLQWVRFAPDAAHAETVEGWLLRVVGKGNRAHEVPVPNEVTIELADYFARPLTAAVCKPGTSGSAAPHGLFDASVGTKPAISEYKPDANLRDTAHGPLLENSCLDASIRREWRMDGLLKGARA